MTDLHPEVKKSMDLAIALDRANLSLPEEIRDQAELLIKAISRAPNYEIMLGHCQTFNRKYGPAIEKAKAGVP